MCKLRIFSKLNFSIPRFLSRLIVTSVKNAEISQKNLDFSSADVDRSVKNDLRQIPSTLFTQR